MENFNQFADRIRLRFRCVNCEQTIEQEFNVPAPHLDRGDNSADTENTSEAHCQCANCQHEYNIDITTNELDGMVVVSDGKQHDIETISVRSIFNEEEEEEEEEELPQDIIKPSHIITIPDISTNSKDDVFEQAYQEYMDNYMKGIEPTIAFVNSKTITREQSKLLFGRLLIKDNVPNIICKKLSNEMSVLAEVYQGIKDCFVEKYPTGLVTPWSKRTIVEPQLEIVNGGEWKRIQLGSDTIEAMLISFKKAE